MNLIFGGFIMSKNMKNILMIILIVGLFMEGVAVVIALVSGTSHESFPAFCVSGGIVLLLAFFIWVCEYMINKPGT